MRQNNKIMMAVTILTAGFVGQGAKAATANQDQDLNAAVKACLDTQDAQNVQSSDDLASVIASCLTRGGRSLINRAAENSPNNIVTCRECSGGSCNE